MKRHLLYISIILFISCGKQEELPIVDVYGHAGTSLHKERSIYPSNSFESVEYAIDILDADGVEIDVQMTKDSVLVLYHDIFLEESSGFSGCISMYNYNEIKELELENSKYKLVKLKDILVFTESRNRRVYLDIKDYDYCNGTHISESSFQYALNQSLSGVSESYKTKVILGMLNISLLNSIEYSFKCYENSNVVSVIETAKSNNIQSVLFHKDLIGDSESELLTESGLYWGVFGIKDKWSIETVVSFRPNFVITDNITFTKQVSN